MQSGADKVVSTNLLQFLSVWAYPKSKQETPCNPHVRTAQQSAFVHEGPAHIVEFRSRRRIVEIEHSLSANGTPAPPVEFVLSQRPQQWSLVHVAPSVQALLLCAWPRLKSAHLLDTLAFPHVRSSQHSDSKQTHPAQVVDMRSALRIFVFGHSFSPNGAASWPFAFVLSHRPQQ